MLLLLALAFAQVSQSNDPMVRTPPADPFHDDPAVVAAPASSPASADPMVRTMPIDEIDPNPKHKKHKKKHGRTNYGYSFSVHGGVFASARPDYNKVADLLGPGGSPGPVGGMFSLQASADVKRKLRWGADFTFTQTHAYGVGSDTGGVSIRQSVTYQTYAGGLLLEGVLPVTDIMEFSIGASLGGASIRIHENSARVDSFYDLSTDLRAIPKTSSLDLSVPALWGKPSVGVRVLFTESSIAAFDARIGVNLFYAPRGLMRISDDIIAYNSPFLFGVQPFITAGVAFGDFPRRSKD